MRQIFTLKPYDLIFAKCIKCGKTEKGMNTFGWVAVQEDDLLVGCICPDCQTDEESLEAQANTIIADSVKESRKISFLDPYTYRKNFQYLIKVNFPINRDGYAEEIGEAIWCVVDYETKSAHDTDETGIGYRGYLFDDSWNWKGLETGALVPIRMNGQRRPVCPLAWLESNYIQFSEDE